MHMRQKNLPGVAGGIIALIGLFLPLSAKASFFQSLYRPEYSNFSIIWVLAIAVAAILYALEWDIVPRAISMALTILYSFMLGNLVVTYGLWLALSQIRIGGWMLLTGLLMMALTRPFQHCAAAWKKYQQTHQKP